MCDAPRSGNRRGSDAHLRVNLVAQSISVLRRAKMLEMLGLLKVLLLLLLQLRLLLLHLLPHLSAVWVGSETVDLLAIGLLGLLVLKRCLLVGHDACAVIEGL